MRRFGPLRRILLSKQAPPANECSDAFPPHYSVHAGRCGRRFPGFCLHGPAVSRRDCNFARRDCQDDRAFGHANSVAELTLKGRSSTDRMDVGAEMHGLGRTMMGTIDGPCSQGARSLFLALSIPIRALQIPCFESDRHCPRARDCERTPGFPRPASQDLRRNPC